jgi:hypothetical protein
MARHDTRPHVRYSGPCSNIRGKRGRLVAETRNGWQMVDFGQPYGERKCAPAFLTVES